MKKKLLLAILPTILVLTSCGAQPKAEPKYREDTLAHEEVFGDVELSDAALRKLEPKREAEGSEAPEEITTLYKPVLYFQHKDNNDGTYSMRFVATVQSNKLEMTWYRSIHDLGGLTSGGGKAKASKTVGTVYREINAGSGRIAATSVEGDNGATPFKYFAVYCLLNVPSSISNYYVDAYLDVVNGNDSVQSSVGALNVVNSAKRYRYDLQGNNRDTLFVNGYEYLRNGSTQDKISVEYATLHTNDQLEVFYINETDLTLVRNSSITLGASFHDFTIDTDADIVTVKYSGKYHIYVNSSNQFWFKKAIYLNGSTNWDEWGGNHYDTYMQMQYVGSDTGSSTEFKMEPTSNANEYSVYIDTTSYQNAQFHLSNNEKWTNFWGDNPLKNGQNYFSYASKSWSTYVED